MILNYCIGCGCDEAHACTSDPDQGPCWWMRFSHDTRTGVCSYCEDLLRHWDRGGRVLLPELVAERFHRQLVFLCDDKASAHAWIQAPHPQLGGRSPRELIKAGELERIYAVLDQLRDGVFA